jgi:hypothetical protein
VGAIDQLDAGLLDRDDTLRQLSTALASVREGQGTTVVVEGSAGTGKSSLLSAAVRAATADGLQVLRARGGELEQEYAYGMIRQMFEPLMLGASDAVRARLLSRAGRGNTRARGAGRDGDRRQLLSIPRHLLAHRQPEPGSTTAAGGR